MRSIPRDVDPIALAELGTPKVISVGEALLDCVLDVATAQELEQRPGGAPANVATGLTKLGTAAAFVGVVGIDQAGAMLSRILKDARVNCDGLVASAEAPTRRVVVECDAATGERSFVGFGGHEAEDVFADMLLTPDDFPGVLFYAAQFLVTGTLALGLQAGSVATALREAVSVAHMCQLQVVVDINWRPIFWTSYSDQDARQTVLEFVTSSANWVKLSDEDAAWLFPELEKPSAAQIKDKLQSHKLQGVLLTLGAKGVSYAIGSHRGDMEPIMTESMKPVDTTGGGDAFVAGFLSETLANGGPGALLDGGVCRSVVQFAMACGALTVCGEGAMAAQPTREQVESYLQRIDKI